MAPYQSLIENTINADIERKRANPGVANLGALIRAAMELSMTKAKEGREAEAGNLNAARSAVYNQFPEVAGQVAGLEIPQTTPNTIPQGPPGMALSRVQYDEKGRPTTVYENPTAQAPTPSWGQEQRVEALKTGLRMGKVVIGKEFGEPSVYEAKSMEDALKAIQDAGLSPSLFGEELKLYDIVEERAILVRQGKKKVKRLAQKLADGRIIWADTKELMQ